MVARGTSTYDDMNVDGTTGEGSNAEEGLAEETPQCFSEMRHIFGGLFGCLSGNDAGTCCEGESGNVQARKNFTREWNHTACSQSCSELVAIVPCHFCLYEGLKAQSIHVWLFCIICLQISFF